MYYGQLVRRQCSDRLDQINIAHDQAIKGEYPRKLCDWSYRKSDVRRASIEVARYDNLYVYNHYSSVLEEGRHFPYIDFHSEATVQACLTPLLCTSENPTSTFINWLLMRYLDDTDKCRVMQSYLFLFPSSAYSNF